MKPRIAMPVLALFAVLLSSTFTGAQATHENNIYAQKLVDQTIAKHPELRQMGLHATPPNSSESVIIAINDPKKVGKKSDPDDLDVMKTGKPSAELIARKEIYDLGYPLLDRNGKIIGTIVMEVKLSAENTKEGAMKRGEVIQAELQKQIPSKEKLFETVQ
jgi:iron complex outermembrane receptor protein